MMYGHERNLMLMFLQCLICMVLTGATVYGFPMSNSDSEIPTPGTSLQRNHRSLQPDNLAQRTTVPSVKHDIENWHVANFTDYRQDIRPSGVVVDSIRDWITPTGAVVLILILLLVSIFTGFLLRKQYRTNRLLKKRSKELEEARRKAEQANRAKDDFLARMSHDIRTPLNAIMGMTDLLNKTALDREQKEYVQTCRQASNTLLILINDILDLSKVESGNLTLEQNQLQLEPLIMDIVSYFARKAHEQNLALPVYIDPDCPAVIGDQNRIQQILVNLIQNALKFTDSGEIAVRVHPVSASDQTCTIRFEVKDTGIGIPQDRQEHIFQRFSQANAEISQDFGGTGLGLAICKHLTEHMNGEIGVESEQGKGSLFWFEIPFDLPEQEVELVEKQKKKEEEISESLSGTSVLIVDDNETIRSILMNTLEECGVSASAASDSYQALEKVNRANNTGQPFDLVLIDRHMPDMNGFELAGELQDTIPLSRIGIMLTSNNLSTDRDRARRLGFGDYLVKPVSRSILLESINRLQTEEDQFQPIHSKEQALPEWENMDTPPRLLIAEDNEHNRKLMKAILQQYPVRMDFVDNGKKALKMAKSGLFDLIFMDVRMPKMSGLEATRKFRQWEEENNMKPTPVIALTAQALEENRQESLDAGCNEHLTKPVRENILVRTIREHMLDDETNESSPSADPGSEPEPDLPSTKENSSDATDGTETPPDTVEIDQRFEDFIPDFIDDVLEKTERIQELVEQEEKEEVSNLAHDIKGSSGSFGFQEIQNFAEEMETASEEGNFQQVNRFAEKIQDRLEAVSISYI